ncbi:MAG: hypothetical protein JWP63_6896 [Candidatus Solibacter sp.]|nr:hypothetical protein [Candidatus Solibacter sp.]
MANSSPLRGHTPPEMTMLDLEVALPNSQREFHLARSQLRHLAPQPKSQFASSRAGWEGVINALLAARHVMEMFRRDSADVSPTVSPKHSPKPANSTCPENEQRLAGNVPLSKTDPLPLSRVTASCESGGQPVWRADCRRLFGIPASKHGVVQQSLCHRIGGGNRLSFLGSPSRRSRQELFIRSPDWRPMKHTRIAHVNNLTQPYVAAR